MPDGNDARTVKVIRNIDEIAAADWDACAGTGNPFVRHAFLRALEVSNSASDDTGWLPHHIVIEDTTGRSDACAPVYLKTHSYGEYVFDWGWADAYERAGGRYYPKLQCAVPFTPVPGPRLLTRHEQSDETARANRRLLAQAMITIADQLDISSAHITFCDAETWRDVGGADYLQRVGQQFHWHNQGYADFDDFLSTLSSRKRKAIKKERRKVAESGLDIRALSGDELTETHWDAFYQFYLSTTDKKWGQSYLSRAFFSELGATMADDIALVLAFDNDTPVAGALNLRGSDCLYGRNWGSVGRFKFLHFECCYYQAIDYAITHGLARVEAGAQGPHKVQRGYLPVETYSLHHIRSVGLRDAVARFLDEEQEAVRREMEMVVKHYSPYKDTRTD